MDPYFKTSSSSTSQVLINQYVICNLRQFNANNKSINILVHLAIQIIFALFLFHIQRVHHNLEFFIRIILLWVKNCRKFTNSILLKMKQSLLKNIELKAFLVAKQSEF